MASTTHGTVSVEGKRISYDAVAGTMVLDGTGNNESTPEVAIGYFAYFKQGARASNRPVTFIYNGGPGSSTIWLHMGSFGPKRVVTADASHTPAAPYELVDNEFSLLDVSDLVFIDMPGTGFGRLLPRGNDKDALDKSHKELAKKIWGIDGDAQAFAGFITQFLTKYDRWNSPKYLFGESYGTARSAALANILQSQDNVDLNGIILLSAVLNWEIRTDGPVSPGMDLRYELQLPSLAATAFYHKKVPNQPAALEPFLQKATQFAMGEYAQALLAGSQLDDAHKQAVAKQLYQYTGLPAAIWLKANLRLPAGVFRHELLADSGQTTGRLDSRFSGPQMDPLSESSEYDPMSTATGSAYVAAFNSYVRKDLKFGDDLKYRPSVDGADDYRWDYSHTAPGNRKGQPQQSLNVMGDLAAAMKENPNLKVYVHGGYFDTATPFYAAQYEMEHLPIPASLVKNISYSWYPSGHMVYLHLPSLKALHDNVAKFIGDTDTAKH
ncbi:MAG: peptidase S10 [Rhodanobacter sp.]